MIRPLARLVGVVAGTIVVRVRRARSSPTRSGPAWTVGRDRRAARGRRARRRLGAASRRTRPTLGNVALRRCSIAAVLGSRRSCAARGALVAASCRRSTSPPSSGRTVLVAEPSVTRLHPARRAADRADERAAAGAARHARGWRSSDGRALLELKGVSKAFGGLQVIDGLDLHVDEGEIVSVIGPNGAGKTTLFNLDHRRLPARRGRHPARRASRSSASRRTRSRSAGSRARSRRCGCS